MRHLSNRLCALCVTTALTGCSQSILRVHEVEPLKPVIGYPYRQIESLRPTFAWKAVADQNATYDLIVYPIGPATFPEHAEEPIRDDGRNLANTAHWRAGRDPAVDPLTRRIRYQENIRYTTHTMTDALEPCIRYGWAVRIRHGDDVGEWSTFEGRWHRSRLINDVTRDAGYVMTTCMVSLFTRGYGAVPPSSMVFVDTSEDITNAHHPFVFETPRHE